MLAVAHGESIPQKCGSNRLPRVRRRPRPDPEGAAPHRPDLRHVLERRLFDRRRIRGWGEPEPGAGASERPGQDPSNPNVVRRDRLRIRPPKRRSARVSRDGASEREDASGAAPGRGGTPSESEPSRSSTRILCGRRGGPPAGDPPSRSQAGEHPSRAREGAGYRVKVLDFGIREAGAKTRRGRTRSPA